MQCIIDAVGRLPAVAQTLDAVAGEGKSPAAVFGLPDAARAAVSLCTAEALQRKTFVVTADEAAAFRFATDVTALGKRALVFPARDYNFRQAVGFSREYDHKRLHVLWKILQEDFDVVVMDIAAFTGRVISPDLLWKSAFEIAQGDTVDLAVLQQRLVAMGYTATEQVDGPGQFAVRGGILDVYSPGMECPVRAELWGDEVDLLSGFSVEDQRRTDDVERLTVLPAVEWFMDGAALQCSMEQRLKKGGKRAPQYTDTLLHDLDALKSGLSICCDRYLDLLRPAPAAFADYMIGGLLVIEENRNVFSRLKALSATRLADFEALFEEGLVGKQPEAYWLDKKAVVQAVKDTTTLYVDSFSGTGHPVAPAAVAAAAVRQLSCWGGGMDVLIEDVEPALRRGCTVLILAGTAKGADILLTQLESNGIAAQLANPDDLIAGQGVFVMPGSLSSGLDMPEANLLLITHKAMALTDKKRRKRAKGEMFHSLDELKIGDYVVHFAHGIGQFDGIHRIETDNVIKDYIKIKYRGTDVLYVPVTQLDLVSRYIGATGENGPMLHRLGGVEWQKTRTRVRAAVKDIAKELTRLYAARMEVKGHAFMEDNPLQADFEARFPFEETDDQLRAIAEIKADMQRPVPMDRLLCGDVGFGKTEVALRAAFKCICEGKQCALLVPTTILAWQHYLTATERFGDLLVHIEMLSRFRSRKEIEKTVAGLKTGDVDMVIGTHRLISKDVRFRDLGLVIVDEEQRFGVAQKERLKSMFTAVDVLTLTATPIPRTLNMALSGIRDMSAIEEAPQDRQPVQTYVMEQNNGVLLEAIRRELRRGGQVYYMHNRVESITHCAARLAAALPDATIGVAHGQMGEEELSEVWRGLLEGEIDVLVCTSIIETGVDVPNANTLIIEDADRMGLAQLHQIRGRVGRSNRRAYAYFCFRYGKALSEIATKRLEAIREYTEFGSGFKIAMRDLEIRGAGSILGGEQHGHMEAVGYDMYVRLLNDAVHEERGEPKQEAMEECAVDLNISANIPEQYIPSLSHRLGMYRRIADIRTGTDREDVIDELCDRFGEPPREVMGLIEIAMLRAAASRHGICEITGGERELRLYFTSFSLESAAAVLKILGDGAVLVTSSERPYINIKLKTGEDPRKTLRHLSEKL